MCGGAIRLDHGLRCKETEAGASKGEFYRNFSGIQARSGEASISTGSEQHKLGQTTELEQQQGGDV